MTHYLAVVDDPKDWPLDSPGVDVLAADDYLANDPIARRPRTRVINLCRSLRYQTKGYYVSLLAEARKQRPLPTVNTVQELKSAAILRGVSSDLDDLIQSQLKPLVGDSFELSVYFGRNVAKRYDPLAAAIFRAFQIPLMRAHFKWKAKAKSWTLAGIDALEAKEVPPEHGELVAEALADFVAGRSPRPRRKPVARYDLAILRDEDDPDPASDPKAIQNFVKAGEAVGFAVEVVDRNVYSRTAEFDAIFIRDTTAINHHTYRIVLKAKAEGLVVMDDPDAIIKCMNKVFLAELMTKNKIASPNSMIVTKRNADQVLKQLGLPCVLKQPDSAFSAGVSKASTPEELREGLDRLLKKSSLVIAQEFRPTDFDWRIGVLDGQPLYACKYYMAGKHWQIAHHHGTGGSPDYGRVEALPVEQAPGAVLDIAVRAAMLYGDGLFGVDVKEIDGKPVVIEVNDNPTIDAGDEDGVLGEELYLRIMRHLMARVEQKKRAGKVR
ncbi:carbamoyl phosphate synthase-like protein [Planctomycetes bacterium Poly30]|uniref:Carbamoyl phosphate synthase-like protein n=1 Tax=Saltatorellus ferox TaxID=2528018 RepID=A0A518EWX0_9BACT|nr:carbamoyl phosphate synthase-like protein [Planctomycetes bacterium Poly30]